MTVKLKRRRPPSPRRRARAAVGSLHDTLVDAAVALIARKGPQGFSLREVARRAHVSESAPYWHFADREALLAAVAERGFVELAEQMMEIWSRAAGPGERFRALGVGYVHFAVAHPSYLRVMFGSEVPDKAVHPALEEAATRTFGLLVQAITECQEAKQVRGGDAQALAVAAWSIVHGLAALLVDGKLKNHAGSAAAAEQLAQTVTGIFMQGMAPRR